ncbi:hypothetical protein [Haloprofundus halophilus]|uniref:hypothetical protein n=1 Tax=Haloprofundus halophilus TaxID=2283527 RepID=UPI000E452178|nr:hypothetical protein [Haloprofundus halophilus]
MTESTESESNSSFGTALSGSRIVRAARSAADRLGVIADRARPLVMNSYLYRWLTAEPDPEVIVIDLRETYTVGPFVRLLDRLAPPIRRAFEYSAVGRLAVAVSSRLVTGGERVAETRLGKLVVAALEPPKHPRERVPRTQTANENDVETSQSDITRSSEHTSQRE